MANIEYLPETQKVVTALTDGPQIIQIYSNTNITNSSLFININEITEHSPLTYSEVNQNIVDAPEEKILVDQEKTLVRVSEALKWNDSKLRDPDPAVRQKAKNFEDAIISANIQPTLVNERTIASETVEDKSKKAKSDYRKQREIQGLGSICEETNQQITEKEKIHIHHDPRVADYPELAAEESTLNAIGSEKHHFRHKDDNKLL